jgi:hypothetical protein
MRSVVARSKAAVPSRRRIRQLTPVGLMLTHVDSHSRKEEQTPARLSADLEEMA